MLSCSNASLYIVLFLHQTTTNKGCDKNFLRCISYYSYIKPQPCNSMMFFLWVVYRTIPTSNHNLLWHRGASQKVVYRTIPTSNHNLLWHRGASQKVVYRTIPTSNHNFLNVIIKLQTLYIVLFLHQTTTPALLSMLKPLLYIVLFLHQTTTG